MEQKHGLIDQLMKKDLNIEINAMAAIGMFEALSKKVAECKDLVEQYKKTYPEIMHGGIAIVMAAGLFSMIPEDTEGIMSIEFVEGYRGPVKNMVNKLKEDVEE